MDEEVDSKKLKSSTEQPLSPPWLDLPDPITELILEKLPLPDYVRFAAVCQKWRSIQNNHRLRFSPSQPPMSPDLPWIIPALQSGKIQNSVASVPSTTQNTTSTALLLPKFTIFSPAMAGSYSPAMSYPTCLPSSTPSPTSKSIFHSFPFPKIKNSRILVIGRVPCQPHLAIQTAASSSSRR